MPQLSAHELDAAYTALCKAMTEIGEERAPLFLARLALLSMECIGDATVIDALIADAARDMHP